MKRLRGLSELARDDRGAVTIEFVVTLPLFLAALAFSFEFGRFFLAYQSVENNVRSAARYMSRVALTGANENQAERIIRRGVLSGGTTPDYLQGVCQAPNPDCVSWAGTTISLSVRVNFPLSIFGFVDSEAPATIPFVIREDIRWVGM